ncbi:MAG TPA: metalloregulator ArsR/SmtB family transcription factor [Patescibacteria group bacterium]|nr:metalloregulator ArsR/SmtB family transcription factor [Patescibacteria group bacterium]
MNTQTIVRQGGKLPNGTDRRLSAVFKALGDTTRFRIFRLLIDQPQISVSAIAKVLHLSAPLTSQHIKILVHAQLLEKQRTGKRIYSRPVRTNPVVRDLIRTIQKSIKTEPIISHTTA